MPDVRISPPGDVTLLIVYLADRGKLHQYTMAGMGYRVEGKQAYINIILYYPDIAEARDDGEEIQNRVKSYLFNTQFHTTPSWLVGCNQIK